MSDEVFEAQDYFQVITKHKAIQTPSKEVLKDELEWV